MTSPRTRSTKNWDKEQAIRMTTMMYNRLFHHLKGAALTIHQGVVGENGLEVWRRLARMYNPMTPMRGMQIMLKVMLLPKIGKNQDVHTQVTSGRASSTSWSGTTQRRSRT